MRIAVVAPAWPPDARRLEQSIALVESWGHDVVIGRHVGAPRRRDAAVDVGPRLADLEWSLYGKGIDAVWFARGGYGTAHLLSAIDWSRIDDRLVIGFSDATALLAALHERGVGRAVHGPSMQTLAGRLDLESQAAMRGLLDGARPAAFAVEAVGEPTAILAAPLIGGNLTVLASLCATPWELDASGAILALEDVGEAPYRIHRLLTQLMQSGALDEVGAVALGDFHVGADDPSAGIDVAADVLAACSIRCVRGMPIGHGRRNFPFHYGATAEIVDNRLRPAPGRDRPRT